MHRSVGVFAVVAATMLAACSQKEAASVDSSKVAQAGAATKPANRGSFDPATHTAVIYAKDFAFEAPDSITSGWTTIRLVNDGPNLHHAQLVRLDSGKTAQDFEAAMKHPGPPPAWAAFVGGPNSPDPMGGTVAATFNLSAGNYVLVCLIGMPEHMPHFARGMVKPLTVTAATGAPSAEPTGDATVSLSDYSFTVKGALNAGPHTIKVVNDGKQLHEIEVVRLAAGKTAKDVVAWVNNPNGPPPGNAVGGVVAVPPTGYGYFTADLPAGNYAFLCFLPDAKDGKMHVDHGMMKQLTIQ